MAAAMRGRKGWALGKSAATSDGIARGVAKRLGVRRGMYHGHRQALEMASISFIGGDLLVHDQRSPYVYLLGMYLGDGYLAGLPQRCRFEIACDAKYSGIIRSLERAMRTVSPYRTVASLRAKENCVRVYSYGWRWLALFPHHGPGRKHERKIELRDWQQVLVDEFPLEFLRGLIHSDGCRTVRRQDGKEYAFYSFDNRSEDILAMFCRACDSVGVRYTRPKSTTVSVARRPDVAFLDQEIGPKG